MRSAAGWGVAGGGMVSTASNDGGVIRREGHSQFGHTPDAVVAAPHEGHCAMEVSPSRR